MTKKHFIALADVVSEHNRVAVNNNNYAAFTQDQIEALAQFCRHQNYHFNESRWLAYIAGECGPNGGAVRKAASDVDSLVKTGIWKDGAA